jgi:hypothetical protein
VRSRARRGSRIDAATSAPSSKVTPMTTAPIITDSALIMLRREV